MGCGTRGMQGLTGYDCPVHGVGTDALGQSIVRLRAVNARVSSGNPVVNSVDLNAIETPPRECLFWRPAERAALLARYWAYRELS